ncbi:unnamed protein product [Anisakis simplex]|uniref:Probable G-protein coupled receptor (inferred by orthology to a C. elegans protein) n=1 Tax=Anisakis simplex TaxID=6269 RepID=A0A0M3JSI4_ANISI|nr:unnamed protein product [Anisakis simplex]
MENISDADTLAVLKETVRIRKLEILHGDIPSSGFTYLKACAIADILSIVALIPFILRHAQLHDQHSHSAMLFHAHIELPLVNALMCAGALCIVAMTVDRYISICHPITCFKSGESRYNIKATIFTLFVLSFIVFVPSAWQKLTIKSLDAKNHTIWKVERNAKLNNTNEFRIYIAFREFFAKLGPIVILVVLNSAIIRNLYKFNSRRRGFKARQTGTKRTGINHKEYTDEYHTFGNSPNRWDTIDRTENETSEVTIRMFLMSETVLRVSILLLITSTTFVVCTLPASILSLFVDHFNNRSLSMQIFRAIANLLQASSYLYNFYLYALCSSEYRRALLKWIGFIQKDSPSKSFDSRALKYPTTVNQKTHVPLQDSLEKARNGCSLKSDLSRSGS